MQTAMNSQRAVHNRGLFSPRRLPDGTYRIGIFGLTFCTVIAALNCYFFLELLFPKMYNNGDNEYYRNAYQIIRHLDLLRAYEEFPRVGGSGQEPLSFLALYLSSKFLEYEKFVIYSNFLFNLVLGLALCRWFRFWHIPFVLVSFSFYSFVGSNLTQRLGVGLIILFVSFIFTSSKKRNVLALFSTLGHFQLVLVTVGAVAAASLKNAKVIAFNPKQLLFITTGAVFTSFVSFLASDKIDFYLARGLENIWESFIIGAWPAILMLAGLRVRLEHLVFFGVFLVVSILIGPGRMNIVCFFVSLYFLRGNDGALLKFSVILTPYMIYKIINYMPFYVPGYIFWR